MSTTTTTNSARVAPTAPPPPPPTPSIAAAWAQAATNKSSGINAVAGMPLIQPLIPPNVDAFLTMAQIVGYVYADNYWNGMQMVPGLLATDMVAGTGWGLPDCQQAAATAFATWAGFYVRKNADDNGEIPYTGQNFCESPSIVANGPYAIPLPALLQNWDGNWWNIAVGGQPNVLYTRGQVSNFHTPIQNAVVRMFVSDAGFNVSPTSWQKLYTATFKSSAQLYAIDGQTSTLNNGDQAANADPMVWYPPTNYVHFCGIAAVGTEFFTNDPLLTPVGNWSSATWLVSNGAAAWHNLTNQTDRSIALAFHNQDDRPERFAFEAHATNVPSGTTVTLTSDHAALAQPVTKQGTIAREQRTVVAEGTFPAKFEGHVNVDIDVPGRELLPHGASVDVRMYWLLEPGHPNHADAVERYGVAAGGNGVRVPLGNYTILGAV
jgi:hypothetical protein